MMMTTDFYDDLDYPNCPATHTNHSLDPKTLDDYVEFIKLGNQIKESLVRRTRYETSTFMLRILRATINEQVELRLLTGSEGDYIYSAVEDLAIKKGYAAW